MKIKKKYSNLSDITKNAWNDEIKPPKNKTEGPNFKFIECLFYSFPYLPFYERIERYIKYINSLETDIQEVLDWMKEVDNVFYLETVSYAGKHNIDIVLNTLKDSTKRIYKSFGKDTMGMF